MASKSSSSTATSSSSSQAYDVFLSFRGEDVRKAFLSHLYYALCERGIATFIDEQEVKGGERFEERIMSAIEGSAISIPILSKNYADSRWCLMESAKMVQLNDNRKEPVIIPLFYHVEPTEVRHQKGQYGPAFQQHLSQFDEETVAEWRRALKKVADFSGYDIRSAANGYEAKVILLIVDRIQTILKSKGYGDNSNNVALLNDVIKMENEYMNRIFELYDRPSPLFASALPETQDSLRQPEKQPVDSMNGPADTTSPRLGAGFGFEYPLNPPTKDTDKTTGVPPIIRPLPPFSTYINSAISMRGRPRRQRDGPTDQGVNDDPLSTLRTRICNNRSADSGTGLPECRSMFDSFLQERRTQSEQLMAIANELNQLGPSSAGERNKKMMDLKFQVEKMRLDGQMKLLEIQKSHENEILQTVCTKMQENCQYWGNDAARVPGNINLGDIFNTQ